MTSGTERAFQTSPSPAAAGKLGQQEPTRLLNDSIIDVLQEPYHPRAEVRLPTGILPPFPRFVQRVIENGDRDVGHEIPRELIHLQTLTVQSHLAV